MTYRLKPGGPAIDLVDGPLAGQKYEHGRTYAEIPPGMEDRFEAVEAAEPAPAGSAKPRKAATAGEGA